MDRVQSIFRVLVLRRKAPQQWVIETYQPKLQSFQKKWGRSPDRVAKAVLKGVRRNKSIVPVGVETWLLWFTMRLSVRLHERIVYTIVNKLT